MCRNMLLLLLLLFDPVLLGRGLGVNFARVLGASLLTPILSAARFLPSVRCGRMNGHGSQTGNRSLQSSDFL